MMLSPHIPIIRNISDSVRNLSFFLHLLLQPVGLVIFVTNIFTYYEKKIKNKRKYHVKNLH
jgi:hypothetical protein